MGNIIAAAAIIVNSLPGIYHHLGFPVFNRAVWGMRGAQFAIWNRIFLSFVWYGFTSWVGGQCVYVVLLSWDPNLEEHIPNTMSEDTGMTTAQFVAYVIFCTVSLPFIWIKPYRLQGFFRITGTVTLGFFLVLLIWALSTMGSAGFGDTMSGRSGLPSTGGPDSVAWLMVYGTVSTVGSISSGILNQADYTRFATRPAHALWGQAVPYPLYAILGSLVGILVTAATQHRFGGEAVWDLPTLFVRLMAQAQQRNEGARGTRAACFFAGLCLAVNQLGLNVTANALAGGFDLAATFPRFINIRRGAYFTALLSIAVNPWRLVNTSTTFLTVLSSYSVFLAPMTGLMVSSYLVVNRRKINVDDLYNGTAGSIYWYNHGCNWRAPAAWLVGVLPCAPGFIAAVNPSVQVTDGATELYYMSYIYGFLSSGAVYAALHWAFPADACSAFVRDAPSAKEVRHGYLGKWDVVLSEMPAVVGDLGGE
ncbi:hypothetical protein DL766_004346 [Monosporascus sp. MC13-8B]|uniref:Allantoin permease n=1 Tax=Monosporascus cannonballus TaxID=155416 RepID=A0ABY0HH78_9PEZI|nr:hypothetical protein DL762_001306 [Monosporascus cannonballus]RYP01633.1 hypothetical protein DL763_000022 [Monosporascus cannonballus]RYP31522.1 hypothetical protein DL766_004346 [Monosporascus sp. MC13-8B]